MSCTLSQTQTTTTSQEAKSLATLTSSGASATSKKIYIRRRENPSASRRAAAARTRHNNQLATEQPMHATMDTSSSSTLTSLIKENDDHSESSLDDSNINNNNNNNNNQIINEINNHYDNKNEEKQANAIKSRSVVRDLCKKFTPVNNTKNSSSSAKMTRPFQMGKKCQSVSNLIEERLVRNMDHNPKISTSTVQVSDSVDKEPKFAENEPLPVIDIISRIKQFDNGYHRVQASNSCARNSVPPKKINSRYKSTSDIVLNDCLNSTMTTTASLSSGAIEDADSLAKDDTTTLAIKTTSDSTSDSFVVSESEDSNEKRSDASSLLGMFDPVKFEENYNKIKNLFVSI
jgi:hypothetical protein